MTPAPPTPTRTQRRQQEREQRKINGRLMCSVSRLELSQVLAPTVNAVSQHDALLSFIEERGLVVEFGPVMPEARARLDLKEFEQWLKQKAEDNAKQAEKKDGQ